MQKILVFDIETAPIIAHVWGLKDQNIGLNQIISDSAVVAWAAKWFGDPASAVMYRDQRNAKDIRDDKNLLLPLWRLLDEADIVVTQNGKNFDCPVLNARFIYHGFQPPSPYKHLDTYQIVKKAAKFTSSKLAFLTSKLCTKYVKLEHKKFPGFDLWTECLKGNKAAWDEMKKYNIQDVLSTEELYTKLRPWTPQNAAAVSFKDQSCVACGEIGHLQQRGEERTLTGSWKRLKCTQCGKWQRGLKEKAA